MGSVHTIMHDVLGKRKVCAKFVPHSLTPEQKEQCVLAATDFVQCTDDNPTFLNSIITGDETWCFEYEP